MDFYYILLDDIKKFIGNVSSTEEKINHYINYVNNNPYNKVKLTREFKFNCQTLNFIQKEFKIIITIQDLNNKIIYNGITHYYKKQLPKKRLNLIKNDNNYYKIIYQTEKFGIPTYRIKGYDLYDCNKVSVAYCELGYNKEINKDKKFRKINYEQLMKYYIGVKQNENEDEDDYYFRLFGYFMNDIKNIHEYYNGMYDISHFSNINDFVFYHLNKLISKYNIEIDNINYNTEFDFLKKINGALIFDKDKINNLLKNKDDDTILYKYDISSCYPFILSHYNKQKLFYETPIYDIFNFNDILYVPLKEGKLSEIKNIDWITNDFKKYKSMPKTYAIYSNIKIIPNFNNPMCKFIKFFNLSNNPFEIPYYTSIDLFTYYEWGCRFEKYDEN